MPNSRAKRTLVRWKDEHDKELLLWIVHVCAEGGIKIPFDKVAWCMGENFTEGAVTQHLAKLRTKAHNESLHVPNAPRRPMNPKLGGVPGHKRLTGPMSFKKRSQKPEDSEEPYEQLRSSAVPRRRSRQEIEEEEDMDQEMWTNDPEDDYENARKRRRELQNPFIQPSNIAKRARLSAQSSWIPPKQEDLDAEFARTYRPPGGQSAIVNIQQSQEQQQGDAVADQIPGPTLSTKFKREANSEDEEEELQGTYGAIPPQTAFDSIGHNVWFSNFGQMFPTDMSTPFNDNYATESAFGSLGETQSRVSSWDSAYLGPGQGGPSDEQNLSSLLHGDEWF